MLPSNQILEVNKTMTCIEWLKGFLSMNGKVEVGVIRKLRKTMGYTKSDISRAKEVLGVIVENKANALQSATKWYWRLP